MIKWALPKKLHKYIFKKDIDRALGLLSKLTSINQVGLFTEYDEEYLRYAGYYRIWLLNKWGYYREALAWACLDCELYPGNPKMVALKNSLKLKIVNLPKEEGSKSAQKKSDWDGIAGMSELKAIVERDIILPFTNQELYKKYDINLPNGYIFYGPPGCGKTFFANKLANKLGFDFINIKPSDVGSIYVHGSQLKISDIFKEALDKAPVVLFFDEFESLVPHRTSGHVFHSYKTEVNEFLAQMENLSEKGILFVAATNYLKNIDEAILRPGRIDKKIFIGPPDLEARIEAFKMYLYNKPKEKIRWIYVGEESEYLTFAEINHIVNEASVEALSKGGLLTNDILLKHIYNYSPSLNEQKISDYLMD